RLGRHFFNRLPADEVMVELDELAVAEVVGRQVIVRDVVRVEAATERSRGLVALSGQPLSVRLQLVADIHRRNGRRNPPRLEARGRIGSRADLSNPELLTGGDDGVADFVAL